MSERGKNKKIGCLTIFILVFFGFLWFNARPKESRIISPIPESPTPKQQSVFSFLQRKKTPSDLADKVNNTIGDEWNDYSVMVEDYNTDFSMGLSETEIFTAASVNKVPILAALYYQAQNGKIDLDRDITLQQNEIQDYGTGSLRYAEPGTVYSIKTLARLMIKQSDNTAAYILGNEIVGLDTIQSLVQQWGMTQTDLVNNKTSNKDISLLFRKIYDEKIVNHAYTQEMLSFLKDTDFETRLPKELPDTVTVFHKIGTEVGTIHDAGIVTDGELTYYIGVFTNDQTDDASSEKLIAKISKVVYDYLR